MIPDQALAIAKQVRQRVKEWTVGNRQVRQRDLEGACAIASYTLWLAYKAAGLSAAELVNNCDHCWVELDGWIVDITATQFSQTWDGDSNYHHSKIEEVYIAPVGVYSHYNYSNPEYRNRESILNVSTWWKPQCPSAYVIKIASFIQELESKLARYGLEGLTKTMGQP